MYLSVEEIDEHLGDKKASAETALTEQAPQENAVISVVQVSSAVGMTPYLDILVEGVPVKALVDSGSQSTIVSRSLLHEVAKKLCSQKKILPKLSPPRVKLYGKDGHKGKRELDITAQTELFIEADGHKVHA